MIFYFLHLITLIFVTLKLTKNIDWSWWIIFAPTIISLTLEILLIATVFSAMR